MQLGMIGLGRMAGQHGAAASQGRPAVRGLRQVAGCSQAVGRGESSRDLFAGRLCEESGKAARHLADGPGGGRGQTIAELKSFLEEGDILIDGGNSYYVDDIRRAEKLAPRGIHYVDVGTSGGVWGLERGYCMMIGGPEQAVKRLDPIFKTLAPGPGDIPRTPGREKFDGTAEQGYLHCGPSARAISSKWSTTASNTASWPLTPKDWPSCVAPTSASTEQFVFFFFFFFASTSYSYIFYIGRAAHRR